MCLSTDSLMMKESLSCGNITLNLTLIRISGILFLCSLHHLAVPDKILCFQLQWLSLSTLFLYPRKARLEFLTNKTVFINTPRTALQLTSFCSGHIQSSAVAMQVLKLREHRAARACL